MGITLKLKAFTASNDTTYQNHKAVLQACQKANVSLPKETSEYFGVKEGSYPDSDLLEEKLSVPLSVDKHYKDYLEEGSDGYEIDLRKLPKEVQILRIYNSY